ncbi:DUF4350 domain-containing protein [[Flexibacter] sp. ATCC 35208]|uniref:DUF4350 domain-containing protein n=1 Tax=[Flexibacter] sp. ATCC 35208 TaxID=1936242 RepID=UPI0009D4B675|nr:DUF4350 domain-containing protein [[Flexibacter] sp. ATCC 35208]OMP80533.1 hypothetical protein BW716_03235 [[Flexibacter] sp. ATCC 35208]
MQSLSRDEDLHLEKQTFSYKDKNPGGCYVMFESLPSFYDGEHPNVVSKPFAATAKKDISLRTGEGILYYLVANRLFTTAEDVDSMIEFVNRGNQLFVAANDLDSTFISRLYTKVSNNTNFFAKPGAEEHYVNHALTPDTVYTRDSIAGGRYFTLLDTARTTILGTDSNFRANFVRINVGKGQVFLLLQPSILTNYFLMYKHNLGSLEKLAAYTYGYYTVYWDEFYKYHQYPQEGEFSQWSVLMRYPALRWALWLLVLLLLLYALFESKRRQRIIPDKVVLTNNSLEFVEALGQLYYQQHDNVNLARKIIMQWLEFIRTKYYLNTNTIDDEFIRRLSHKAGMPLADVEAIIDSIHFIQLADKITDTYLKEFYSKIQAFYLNTK